MATINVTLERVIWTPDGMRDARFDGQPDAVLGQVMIFAGYHRDHRYWVNYQRLYSWEGNMYPRIRRQTLDGPLSGIWIGGDVDR